MFTPIHLGDKRTLIGEHSQQSAPTKAYHLFFEEQQIWLHAETKNRRGGEHKVFVEFRWLQLDESKEVFGECTKPTICANVGGKF